MRKAGRCYIRLKKGHLSRDCCSGNSCAKCRGRQHISICPCIDPISERDSSSSTHDLMQEPPTNSTVNYCSRNTTILYMNTQTSVLLQTVKVWLHKLGDDCGGSRLTVWLVVDSGSQWTYVTSRTRQDLNLTNSRSEHVLCIKTIGTASKNKFWLQDFQICQARFGLDTIDGELLEITAL